MAFTHGLTVRFGEIDRAGIVYFARLLEYCHIAFEEMLTRALDRSLEAHFQRAEWGMPLVHTESDFQAPCRLGDRLTVDLEVERVGRSSVTFAYRIQGPDNDLRATAKLIHAFVDLTSFQPIQVPEELRSDLKRLGLWTPDPND